MAIQNYQHIVAELAGKHPEAWRNAHTGNDHTEDFIKLLAAHLYELSGGLVGLNGKRGNPDDLSDDALAIFEPLDAERHDPAYDVKDRSGRWMAIIDCIGGAGGPNPQPAWSSVGGPSPGAWVKPSGSTGGGGGVVVPPPVKPCPDPSAHLPKPKPQYPGDAVFDAIGAVLFADYAERPEAPNQGMGRWFGRTIWDHVNEGMTIGDSIAKHRGEWRAALGLKP